MFRFLPALLLAACGSVVPDTVERLSGLSPVEADPGGFEIAIAFPEGIDIRPGGARLMLSATRSDTGETNEGSYVLERLDGTIAGDEARPVSVFRVAPADLALLRAQQAIIRAWEAENDDATQGSLGIALSGCVTGGGPAPDAAGSVSIRTEAGGPFLPLIRRGPVSVLFADSDIALLPPCR